MPTHQLQLEPTDVLFFKDGRPMDGASSGHGAAWPLPHILDAALHAALHRSGEKSHPHRSSRNGKTHSQDRETQGRHFGALQTAGPFPISPDGKWLCPRPADAGGSGSVSATHHPLLDLPKGFHSNLPDGLLPVVNSQAPSKDKAEPWLTESAYQAYLDNDSEFKAKESDKEKEILGDLLNDDAIFAAEHNIGIGIDPATNTQNGEQFYSASYLRLKPGWTLGLLASCMDKGEKGDRDRSAKADQDLIATVFPNSGARTHIITGGQQRSTTVLRETKEKLPLPLGISKNFPTAKINGQEKHLLRWTLLTPAIFPLIPEKQEKNITEHPGGWLPSWISKDGYTVQLKDRSQTQRQEGEPRKAWRDRVKKQNTIAATLVAARIPKALPVTGWSLGAESGDKPFGPKSTHLAVPAGAVYYFACDSPEAAAQLAHALNWHGTSPGTEIQNRRSTLLGEKGYGLGVCSSWKPYLPPEKLTNRAN